MAESRSFRASRLDLDDLSDSLVHWFQGQGFEVQSVILPGGDRAVQARKGGWRNIAGLSATLNVGLRPRGGDLHVENGEGRWADKAVAGTVSMFVLWPLAVTAAYGAWQQSQLPKRTFDFIEQSIAAL